MFDHIYNRDGTCHFWDCGRPGVVLAFDDCQPEFANWFCADCWDWFHGPYCTLFKIAIDKRYIGPSHQLPMRAESLPRKKESPPEISVWAWQTDMPGTEHQRKTYCCILRDGDTETKFNLQMYANGLIAVEPYVTHEYDYLDYDGPDEGYDGEDDIYHDGYDEDYYIADEDTDGVFYYD